MQSMRRRAGKDNCLDLHGFPTCSKSLRETLIDALIVQLTIQLDTEFGRLAPTATPPPTSFSDGFALLQRLSPYFAQLMPKPKPAKEPKNELKSNAEPTADSELTPELTPVTEPNTDNEPANEPKVENAPNDQPKPETEPTADQKVDSKQMPEMAVVPVPTPGNESTPVVEPTEKVETVQEAMSNNESSPEAVDPNPTSDPQPDTVPTAAVDTPPVAPVDPLVALDAAHDKLHRLVKLLNDKDDYKAKITSAVATVSCRHALIPDDCVGAVVALRTITHAELRTHAHVQMLCAEVENCSFEARNICSCTRG